MTSQLGTHYEGAILLFTAGCKTSEMEGEAKSKNRRKKLAHSTVLQTAKWSKLQKPFQHTWHFYARFLKEAKQNKNGRPSPGFTGTDWPANGILYLLLRVFWIIVFQQKCAYWDTSGFQEVLPWEMFSTISIHESERCIGHWLLKKWGKTYKSIFSRETCFGRFSGTLLRNVIIQNSPSPPPKKKSISCLTG